MMSEPEVQWTTLAPLWDSVNDLGDDTRRFFRQPAILRFASDNFMSDFMATLNANPAQIKDFRAVRETWRGPSAEPQVEAIDALPRFAQKLYRSRLSSQRSFERASQGVPPLILKTSTPSEPLKLYQPAHQRYYLVSAALVCRIPGQPDRHLESANQERVSFVTRKVVPPTGMDIFESDDSLWDEFAFVDGSWVKTTDPFSLAGGEEQNPLFAVNYTQENGRRRRVLAGLVPVGKRETYLGAPRRSPDRHILPDPNLPPPRDRRTLLFMAQFCEPWKRLIELAYAWDKLKNPPGAPLTDDQPLSGTALEKSLKGAREQIQTTSWYAILDFGKLLRQYIPNVWEALMGLPLSSPLTSAQSSLLGSFNAINLSSAFAAELLQAQSDGIAIVPAKVELNLSAALRAICGGLPFNQNSANQLERDLDLRIEPYDRSPASGVSDWPEFLFPLFDPLRKAPLPALKPGVIEDGDALTAALDRIDSFVEQIEAALPDAGSVKMPAGLIAAQPVMRIDEPAYFVLRCVFERPNCGPLQPVLVSDATEPFLMAGFFDPDAPARPIRIGLPVDTTPAGLRKFDKNTAFMISDVLCGQIGRAKGLGLGDLIRTVLPWPLHKDLDLPEKAACEEGGNPLGMICSISIPIITICALILLMIMVNLLDIIFHWVPYFILCLPFPKFSGKQPAG